MNEIWKSIEGYEGIYEVSNLGRVKSLKFNKEKYLKNSLNRDGYVIAHLSKNAITKSFTLHRLVSLLFIDKVDGKDYINHINGDKLNNKVDNLEWCTIKENVNHSLNNKLRIPPNGVNHYNSRFDVKDVLFIRSSNISESKLALKYGVNRATIGKIKRFERYKNI